MFVITNRALGKSNTLRAFGKTPNPKGPNELRLVEVEKTGRRWKVSQVTDKLSLPTVKALKSKFKLDIDIKLPWYGSLKVACSLFEQAQSEGKSILFFVHGYNNDIADVLKTAQEIEALYNVIVVPFTWPANGGGAISGTASYLSDKGDARASAGALNRVIGKIQQLHLMMIHAQQARCKALAAKKHPNNHEAATTFFSCLVSNQCSINISLLCHSMGNYVFKHTFSTSQNTTSKLVFDNVCLVAADVNNHEHERWVSQIDTRKRVYIVMNENDAALRASRIKPGEEQKARLGHYIRKLYSPNAHYLDLSHAEHIGSNHSYFKGDTAEKNAQLHAVFNALLNGESVEDTMTYHTDNNTYTL